jgi:hypothetical protein
VSPWTGLAQGKKFFSLCQKSNPVTDCLDLNKVFYYHIQARPGARRIDKPFGHMQLVRAADVNANKWRLRRIVEKGRVTPHHPKISEEIS